MTTVPLALVSPPRFPDVPTGAPHYESYYLKACHPDGGLGVWIRYTVHKRPNQKPKGFVWFTLFDATAGVSASKAQSVDPGAGKDQYIHVGESRFAPGHVSGRATSDQLDAAWDLRFEGDEPPVWHLPSSWMYRARFPRTKVLSPHPGVRFSGRVDAGERTIAVEKWPGTVGHNWGAEHAARAIWLHGANFDDHPRTWLDVAIGRVKLGPVTTPWIANGVLSLDGRRYTLGGLQRLRSTRIEESPVRCRFQLAGDEVSVEGLASAPQESFVGWIYAQPNGGERQTVNSSIADMSLEITRPASPPLTLQVEGGAAYELQMQERYLPIPVQPFPDG